MQRRSVVTVGCSIFFGLAATNPLMTSLHGEGRAANRDEAQPAPRAQIIRIAEELQLHWVGDGPQDRPQCKLILSDLPIRPERQAKLNIHQPAMEPWHGTVAVYVGRTGMCQANCDPEHPERYAVWCNSFVYGDPELIARLRTCTQ